MIHLHTNLHIPSSNGTLFMVIKHKSEYIFHEAAMLLYYILQKFYLKNAAYVSKLYYHASFSGAHPASYPMSTRRSFPGSKAAGAWSWPLTSM